MYLLQYLNKHNIKTEFFCDENSIYNLYGEYIGDSSRKNEIDLMFLGHLDVVPAGDLESWSSNPFEMIIRNNIVYGRGAVDMKSSIASFIEALIGQINSQNRLQINIAIAITGDEETTSYGAQALLRYLYDKKMSQLFLLYIFLFFLSFYFPLFLKTFQYFIIFYFFVLVFK